MSGALLAVALVVALVLVVRGPLRKQPSAERVILAFAGVVTVLALVSWLLMRLGAYSPAGAGFGVLVFAAAATWATGRWGAPARVPFANDADERGGRAVFPLLVCFGALYALFPTYFLLGGQDPGVYVVFAQHIAKTGGLNLDLPWLRELWEQHPRGLALGYPGIYSLVHSSVSTDPSRLSPQFAHLFPALAANAWALGGIEGLVRVNAPVGVLVLGLAFVFVRRLAGWVAGIASVVLLGLNPAFVWSSRITLTETFAALFLLFGLHALLLASRSVWRGWALLGGALLGFGVLNRLDAGMGGLAVLGFAAASLVERPLAPAARAAAIAYLGTSVLGYLDARLHAPFYFQALVANHHLAIIIGLSTLVGLGALGLASLSTASVERLRVSDATLAAAGNEILRALVAWLVLALFAWPAVDARPKAQAARELGWYLTPVAWPLLVLGLWFLLRRRSWSEVLPVTVVAAGTLFAFTIGADAAPQHIWASRRWVSQVIPLTCVLGVCGAAGIGAWLSRWPRLAGWLTAAFSVAYLAPTIAFARPFLFRTMLAGLPEAYTALVQRIRSLDLPLPLVTSNPHLASTLTYLYDVPTVVIGGRTQFGFNDPVARTLLAEGELGGLGAVGLSAFELNGTPRVSGSFHGDYLEIAQGRRPRTLMSYGLPFDLGRVGGTAFELEVDANDHAFTTEVGLPQGAGAIRTTGRAGTLLRGTGILLTRGQYEVDVIGRLGANAPREKVGSLAVTAERGRTVLESVPLRLRQDAPTEAWLGGLDFYLERDNPDVGFVVTVEAGVELSVTRLRLRRIRAPQAIPVARRPPPAAPL